MKKLFFFAAALMVSSAAMAVDVITVNQENYPTEAEVKDKTAEKTAVEAGAVLGTTASVELKNAFATTYQRVGLNANAYVSLSLGEQEIIKDGQWGIQGNDNPKDEGGTNVGADYKAPKSGAVFQLDVKADGYAYVFHKASSNKIYTVFELYNSEATAMGYDFSMITCPTGKKNDGKKVAWLKDVEVITLVTDSLITYSPTTDEDNYVTGTLEFPEIAFLKEFGDYGKIADSTLVQKNGAYCQNGLGVIRFPVEAGTSYYVNACGSKMSLACVALATAEEATKLNVTVSNGTNTITLLEPVEAPAEGIFNATEAVKATKVIENGQVVIIRGDVRYNALGTVIE